MNEFKFMEEDTRQKIVAMFKKYGEDKFYLSFSGGRDSTILSAFIDICAPGNKIPRVFCDTGIELRMIRDFVLEKQKTDSRVEIITPKKNIREILETYGYPFKSKFHSAYVECYQNAQRKGTRCNALDFYLNPNIKNKLSCPDKLLYQFEPDFVDRLHVSRQCCQHLKEKPLAQYQRKKGLVPIVAIMVEEGGQRSVGHNHERCFAMQGDKLKAFFPFRMVSNAFLDYLCEKYQIKLCDLYYPPYSRKRTGCKGCPFNPDLQKDLDVMQQFFPTERAQCEMIWKPVYDEYRRIGFRLRKDNDFQLVLPLEASEKEKG